MVETRISSVIFAQFAFALFLLTTMTKVEFVEPFGAIADAKSMNSGGGRQVDQNLNKNFLKKIFNFWQF